MSDIHLTDTEVQIIFLIRKLKLFDKVEIKYAKQGEIMWSLTESHRGTMDYQKLDSN